MTFQEMLERYRKECAGKSQNFLSHSLIGEQLAMAEQIEANRLAIGELRAINLAKQQEHERLEAAYNVAVAGTNLPSLPSDGS